MNRLVLFLAAILISGSLCRAQPASPQTDPEQKKSVHISYGPMLGMNVSNFVHSGIDCKSAMNMGFYGGAFLQFWVIPSFSIEGDMSFNYKQSDFTLFGHKGPYRQWTTTIAVYALYHVALPYRSTLTFGVGPYTDFGLSARYKFKDGWQSLYNRNGNNKYPYMNGSETGIGIRIGYEFPMGLQLNAGYRFSIGNVVEANNTKANIHPQTIDLGIAYRFGR